MNPLPLIAADIAAAPSSGDNGSVLLWVVGILTVSFAFVVSHLAGKIKRNEEICAANESRCRDETAAMHLKVEALLNGVVRDQALASARQEVLMISMQATIERNTDAFGSGKHKTVNE